MIFVSLAPSAKAQYRSERYSAVVEDAATGNVLYAASAAELRFPASLTKLMTIYLLFEALRDRRVALDDAVPVSAHAAEVRPSKLGLSPGTRISVEEALLGLVTKSANDAATALGEMMAGGSEDRFAQVMTLRARSLGMTHTVFRNASGLPDPEQVTTAEDMAVLARHLVQDFPDLYRYFSVPGFFFRGRMIPNHDRMLQTFPGADGLKTGYTVASGYNLVTSAVRGGVRLIGVVLGADSIYEREQDMTAMLSTAFQRMGVAPMLADAPPPASRFAALIGSARAEPVRLRRPARRFAALSEPSFSGRGVVRLERVLAAPPRGWARAWGVRRTSLRPTVQSAFATAKGHRERGAATRASHRRWRD